jgi:hypothetical protein
VKNCVAGKNVTFKLEDVEKLAEETFLYRILYVVFVVQIYSSLNRLQKSAYI